MRWARPIPPHAFIASIALAMCVCTSTMRAQDSTRAVQPVDHTPRATRNIARGDTLTAADFTADSLAGDAARIEGYVARRLIRAGEPLRAPAIGKPPLVIAGQTISVRSSYGSVVVARPGIAQSSGALGDSVRVRLDQHTSVTGIVNGRGTVNIAK